jgi:hypothetical protein
MEKKKITLNNPEAFDSVRLKRAIKAELEEMQEEIRRREGLHKRPTLSEVIERLLLIVAKETNDDAHGLPSVQHRDWHRLLEVILEGENLSFREAITKNLRAFALGTLVAGSKTEKEIDTDLEILLKRMEAKKKIKRNPRPAG